MAAKGKNRIVTLLATAVTALSLAGSMLVGANHEGEVYADIKSFFTSADPNEVFYNEATRTKINYEVEPKTESVPEPAEQVTKEEFDSINDAYVSEYFLDYLRPGEQKVYHQLYKGIYEFTKNIPIDSNVLKQEDVGDFIVLFTSSNPYVNYIDASYTISLNQKGYVTAVNVEYSLTKETADAQRKELDRKIDTILEGIKPSMTEYEKVKYLHDYIVTNCTYDDNSSQPYSAYGCLVQGRCVCEGYTKAMLALCDRAGINAIPVVGQAGETGKGQGHIWNKIMIDKKWYDFDVTWDDPVGDMGVSYVRYDYFGLSDRQFERNHAPDENRYMTYPSANSDEADYFVVNGLVCDDAEAAQQTFEKAIELAMKNNEDLARIRCTDKDSYKHSVDDLFEAKNGTTNMFTVLNKVLNKKGADPVSKYSMICNDEAYTITVRFETSDEKSAEKK